MAFPDANALIVYLLQKWSFRNKGEKRFKEKEFVSLW